MSTPADLYRAHIERLEKASWEALTQTRYDALVIGSGQLAKRNPFDDQFWPLRPTPAFAHWTPIAEPDAFLVIRPGHRTQLLRTPVVDYWDCVPAAPPPWQREVFDEQALADADISQYWPGGRVAFISRDDLVPPRGDHNPADLLARLDAFRTRKSAYEIACLVLANQRALKGHAAVADAFAEGMASELDLHLTYLRATAQAETTTPYQNIVALGTHAAVLHWIDYQAAPAPDAESLLLDAGALHLGYGSDITRTWVRGGRATAKLFGELLARMSVLQEAVCARVRPGLPYETLHDQTHELLADLLVAAGIARGKPETLVERGMTRAFFPHGLGHSLGIQTHDVGMRLVAPRNNNPFLRNTSVIEEGQVFTIEPGLYFIEQLLAPLRVDDRGTLIDWRLVDQLRPFGGIRIEDNILVTATGHRNLTRAP